MTKQEMCKVLKHKKLHLRTKKYLCQIMTNCINDDGGVYECLWLGVKTGYASYTIKDVENELWSFCMEDENKRDQALILEHIEHCEEYK